MINGKKVIAVIPARSGSKGLKGKNIIPLNGKPLIAWTIEAAQNSKYIDQYIVSTDDKDIMDVANRYGAETPFIRPDELALDETPTIDVLIHAINHFNQNNYKPEYLILLEPTSPLRNSMDIDKALEVLDGKSTCADSIVGVSKIEATHPIFDVKINKQGLIEPYLGGKFKTTRRQDIEELYYFEGSLYISKTEVLINKKTFYHERALPYIMPRWKAVEIDEIIDLLTAESFMNNLELIETKQ